MGHDSNLFPDPETYKPERWLREGKDDISSMSMASLVWGHGARMCLGKRFKLQDVMILNKFIQNTLILKMFLFVCTV